MAGIHHIPAHFFSIFINHFPELCGKSFTSSADHLIVTHILISLYKPGSFRFFCIQCLTDIFDGPVFIPGLFAVNIKGQISVRKYTLYIDRCFIIIFKFQVFYIICDRSIHRRFHVIDQHGMRHTLCNLYLCQKQRIVKRGRDLTDSATHSLNHLAVLIRSALGVTIFLGIRLHCCIGGKFFSRLHQMTADMVGSRLNIDCLGRSVVPVIGLERSQHIRQFFQIGRLNLRLRHLAFCRNRSVFSLPAVI